MAANNRELLVSTIFYPWFWCWCFCLSALWQSPIESSLTNKYSSYWSGVIFVKDRLCGLLRCKWGTKLATRRCNSRLSRSFVATNKKSLCAVANHPINGTQWWFICCGECFSDWQLVYLRAHSDPLIGGEIRHHTNCNDYH